MAKRTQLQGICVSLDLNFSICDLLAPPLRNATQSTMCGLVSSHNILQYRAEPIKATAHKQTKPILMYWLIFNLM